MGSGGLIIDGEYPNVPRKSCSIYNLTARNTKRSAVGINAGLLAQKLATNCLGHGTDVRALAQSS